MSAGIEGLANKYGRTELTGLDVLQIGESFLDSVGTTVILGHATPAGQLDYTRDTGLLWTQFSRDYIAWTSGRRAAVPGCDTRLRALVADSGWVRFQTERLGDRLDLSSFTTP